MTKKKIAIFASGNGSNAENIIRYFKENQSIEVALVLSNRKDAYVMERAGKLGVEGLSFGKTDFYLTDSILQKLIGSGIDFIVLAGFLWLIPSGILEEFNDRILNIHPALLPKYGGKGMYGEHVHRAVIESDDQESGITIHLVNEKYDEGDIIFQARCPVREDDTVESLAERIHALEYRYFPVIIEKVINQQFGVD